MNMPTQYRVVSSSAALLIATLDYLCSENRRPVIRCRKRVFLSGSSKDEAQDKQEEQRPTIYSKPLSTLISRVKSYKCGTFEGLHKK